MAKRSETIEVTARKLAIADRHDPDAMMVLGQGVPISINGHFAYIGEPRPLWHAYARSVGETADAMAEAGLITFDPE